MRMITKRYQAAGWRSRPSVSRALGVVCAVAAAGLLTGCGGNDTGDSATASPSAEPLQAQATSPSPTDASPASPTAASPSPSDSRLTEDQAERKAIVPKVKIGWDKALDTAVRKVPHAKPVSVELDGPADKPAWKAEVATADGTAHTVRVDAVTGTADQARTDRDQDPDDKRELADLLKKATVTPQQAVRTATDKTKGTVTSVGLGDTDQGAPKWSVDVVTTDNWNKTTYDIDAANRKILREHMDRD
jgi:uncharacterized membrane protein YkoI